MKEETIDLRRLIIKAYHITSVMKGEENGFENYESLVVNKNGMEAYLKDAEYIEKIDVQIIEPDQHDRYSETIMDIIPISTKVLGKSGEGITHTLTGVYVMMTGVDTNGKPTHEFGSSEGNLKENLFLNKAGTPSDEDYIISFDIIFKGGMGQERAGVTEAHRICDDFVQEYRNQMKMFKGDKCTERHEYFDRVRSGKKKVLIIKQVAGQGAMYDTHMFGREPSGMDGGRSIIDMGNMPVVVTPNEYRDGIIRSMQ